MDFPDTEKLRRRLKRFAIVTAVIVGLLSWKSGVSNLILIIRIITAFIVMYAFTVGSLLLFEKAAQPQENEDLRGVLLDIAVGIENEGTANVTSSETDIDPRLNIEGFLKGDNVPGQIDSSLVDKIPDGQHQAEIVRRMGWDNTMTGGGNN